MQFDTYIVPISGILFPKYIAFFSLLKEHTTKKITCASGGCLVSYLALMSNFTSSIEHWKINSALFINKPLYIMPRLLNLILFGHMYNRSNIAKYVMDNFIPCKIKQVEIITGFYSKKTRRTVISSNFSQSESIIDRCIYDIDYEFNDGNMEKIIDSMINTTNIPIMTEPNGFNQNIDFGVICPSPSIFIRNKIQNFVYFCPINLDINTDGLREFLFENSIKFEINNLISNFTDVTNFVNIDDCVNYIQTNNLTIFGLIIYTTHKINLNLSNFDSIQVFNHVQLIKQVTKYKLYY